MEAICAVAPLDNKTLQLSGYQETASENRLSGEFSTQAVVWVGGTRLSWGFRPKKTTLEVRGGLVLERAGDSAIRAGRLAFLVFQIFKLRDRSSDPVVGLHRNDAGVG